MPARTCAPAHLNLNRALCAGVVARAKSRTIAFQLARWLRQTRQAQVKELEAGLLAAAQTQKEVQTP